MIDNILNKLVSRKLAVWAASSGFLYAGLLSGPEWTTLSIIYLSSQAVIDGLAAKKIKEKTS